MALAQAPLIGDLALVGTGAAAGVVVGSPVGKQPSGFIAAKTAALMNPGVSAVS